MSEEKKIDNNKYAIAGASAFIFNEKRELLLTKQPRWKNKWMIPGGKIEYSESLEQTLKREIKEEVNLDIKNIKYFRYVEVKNASERPELHIIVNQFIAEADGGDVKLDKEGSQYGWKLPEDWLKDKDVHPDIKQAIEYYINDYSKKDDLENKYMRALADYQNLLKRTAQEKVEFVKYANQDLIESIIPVYDNLKISLAHVDETVEKNGWLEGIKHVIRQFKDILESMGVEEIKTVGEKFDHNTMEALEGEGDKVIKEVRPGYKLNGKVIVAAKVVVN